MELEKLKPDFKKIAEKYGIDMLVLFGSQATGKTHPKSDVDIGYVSSESFELNTLFKIENDLSLLLQRDDVEVVNLRRISPVMKKIIADEGVLLYEKKPGTFIGYRMYAFKLYVETKPLRELRYQSLRRFAYGTSR